jgi:ribosome maturation factor RimP
MSRNPIIKRLLSIIEPVCIDAGCELVDLRLVMDQGGWVLRVCIDRPMGDDVDITEVRDDRVDLSECERMSRLLSAVLDVDDPVAHPYSLEVSSPGIDRPLRTAAHFTRYVGVEAKIQLAAPISTGSGERRNFRGVLRGVVAGERVVIGVDGKDFELIIEDIDSARVVPDWDAVMSGGTGVSIPDRANAKTPGGKARRPAKPKVAGGAADQRRADPDRNAASDDANDKILPSDDESDDDAPNASSNHSQDVPVPDNR